jgi:hypothetical protein
MATSHLVHGSRATSRSIAKGASLLELIVVLFIISILMGLLFPAIQSARHKAQTTVCLNNVRQLQMAFSRVRKTNKRKFPAPGRWTCELLKYIEEDALADEVANGVTPGAQLPRPRIMRCPMQNDVPSTIADVGICHYVLVVDRSPKFPYLPISTSWEIQDRALLSDDEPLEPWYVGPEISFAKQREWFAAQAGPHTSGAFCMGNGNLRGGE